jgi:hypothetical protein
MGRGIVMKSKLTGLTDIQRERLIHQYVQGLDTGDLDRVANVLEAAMEDPELDRVLGEINLAFQEEQQLAPLAAEVQLVQDLIRQHLPSAFVAGRPEEQPLTVAEVAAHMLAKCRVAKDDQEINRRLLASSQPLPTGLSLQGVRDLLTDLGVAVSNSFLRAFRDAAIMLGMARSHSQAELAAAREERARYAVQGKREQVGPPPGASEDGEEQE